MRLRAPVEQLKMGRINKFCHNSEVFIPIPEKATGGAAEKTARTNAPVLVVAQQSFSLRLVVGKPSL